MITGIPSLLVWSYRTRGRVTGSQACCVWSKAWRWDLAQNDEVVWVCKDMDCLKCQALIWLSTNGKRARDASSYLFSLIWDSVRKHTLPEGTCFLLVIGNMSTTFQDRWQFWWSCCTPASLPSSLSLCLFPWVCPLCGSECWETMLLSSVSIL